MSNLWKRSLSMLMAIVMVFSMLPAHAIAAELEEGETESIVAETEAPEVEETEAPEEEDTEAPEEEETEAPEEEETEAPEEEETEAPEEEETEAPEEEETEAPKAELSGETRKVYFYNVEGWDEVWAAWSFDEEDFDDVAHPGEELDAAAVLEDVYVVTVPVEADDVLFSDGIEVTDELLEEEKLAGVEVTHEVEVELESNEKKDYFDGEGWLNYADEVAAVEAAAAEATKKAEEEAAKKAEEEAAKAAEEAAKQTEPPVMDKAPEPTADPVQVLIESLPASVNSQEEYDAVYAVVNEIENNGYDLTGEQMDAVFAAMNAADEWYNKDEKAVVFLDERVLKYPTDGSNVGLYLYQEADGSYTLEVRDGTAKDYALKAAFQSVMSKPDGTGRGYRIDRDDLKIVLGVGFDFTFSDGQTILVQRGYQTGFLNLGTKYDQDTYFNIVVYSDFELLQNQTVYVNKYATADRITGLKEDVLSAVVPDYTNNPDNYTVVVNATLDYDLDNLNTAATVALATKLLDNSADFVITDKSTGASGTITIALADSRAKISISASTVEIAAEAEPTGDNSVQTQVKAAVTIIATNPETNETTPVAVIDDYMSYGEYAWPDDGQTGEFTYTVSVPTDGTYVGKTVTGTLKVEDTTPVALVTYLDGQGGTLYSQNIVVGEATPTINAPERTGYTFAGWDADGDGETDAIGAIVTVEATYTALWTINTYTVTWDADNDTKVTSVDVQYQGKINAPAAPEKAPTVDTVYTFSHWKDEAGNQIAAGAEVTVTDDVNFTAVYTDAVRRYTITWVNGDETETTEVSYGEMPVPYADAYKSPVNDENGVQKWSYNCAWPELVEVTAAVTYTAICTAVPTEYTITWNVGEGKWADGTTEAKTTSVVYGDIPVAPATPVPNAENHYFAGWVASEEMTVAEELPAVTGEASYTATYSADTFYNVTFKVNGEQYGNIQTVNVTDGEKATEPEAPEVRYFVFKHWSTTENGAEYDFASEVTSDLTLHAVFDEAAAEIGTKGYTTWAAAYAAANTNDTITLLSDIPCYGELRIEKAITVDGNGFKFVADPSYTGWKDTSGKIAKYVKYAVAIASNNVTLKNVTVDCAKLGKGLDILAYDNIVLDNVTVKNEMGNAININGSEVIFRNTIDAHVNGGGTNYSVKAEEGAVFTGRFVFQGTCDYANTDMDVAMATDGTNYFSVKKLDANGNLKGYDTKLPSSLSDGYTYKLLEDMTQSSSATLAWKDSISSATLDLDGHTLTIADGKIIAVQGNLFVKNEGSVVGNIDLAATEIYVEGSADLPVRKNAGVPADYTVVYEDGKHSLYLPLPEAGVNQIKNKLTDSDPDMTFALNFVIKDVENLSEEYLNELFAVYGDYYTDFVMTISGLNDGSVTFNGNGGANGYLGGQYDAWSENWVVVPFDDVTINNGESFYIMKYAADLLNNDNLRFTLAEIAAVVQNFDCGVYFTPEFLEANPDMVVTLELKVFTEKADGTLDDDISVATNEFTNNIVAIIAAEGKQTKYFDSLEAAAEAAAEEDTITLLKDVASAEINSDITIDPNEQTVTELVLGAEGIAITAPAGLNVVSGVEGLDVIYVDGKYRLANDINHNNVPDGEETITIVVNKADDADAVAVEATDAEAKAPVEKTLSTADGTKSYVFDSTKPGIKITAKPVVSEDGISSTYVTSINGEVLSYGENFAASVEMKAEKDAVITVDFDKAEFTYDEDGELRYYVGINTPIAEDLYNAVITDPVYNAECVTDSEGNPTITYLARPAGEYSIRIPVLYEVDLGELLGKYSGLLGILGIPEKIQIGGNKYDMSLEEAWWNVGKPVPTMTEEELLAVCDAEVEAIKAKIATIKIEVSALAEAWEIIQECWADVEDLIAVLSTQAESLGFHEFGADYTYTITDADGNKQTMTARKDADGNIQEVMQVVYTNDAMCLKDDEVIITLVDDRIPTTLVADNLTFEYDEYDNSTLLNSIALKDNEGNTLTGLLDQNGNPVAPKLGSNMSGKEVGEYSFVVSFAGNYDYKPSTAEFTLTVIKAPSNTDVKDQNITYPAKVTGPVITNKHGNVIDVEAFEFILGLDVASLNIDSNGVQGFAGKVQLIVPESLQAIMDAIGLSEGASLSLSELTNLLNNELLSGILGEWGITSDVIDALDGVLGAISDAVDTTDLKIVIGGDYPTNVGAYLHGAVTVDKNYETSYDVGYILIKPQTTEYHLEWSDPALTNAVVTLPMFNAIKDKGACAIEDEKFEVSYVILGVNDDESDILSTDVYGNIKANIWLNADEIKSNGAYMQIAYGIEWGNEFNYAMPIVRGFAVVPAVYDVQLVGANGTPNDELLKEFNNEPQGFSVIVKDNNGKIIYSDHYQNVVALKENAQLIVNYTGVQTNGQPYNSIKKPVHAGVYAATAIYMEFNDGEKLDISDLKVEDLYELFDLADIGMDMGLLVIEPAESTVTVKEKIVNYDAETHILFKDMVEAGSTVKGLKPDTTIISAGIDTDAAFSESGWDAVRGIVNVDFPAWMDALLDQYAPSVKAGMSVAELKDVLLNKLPDISDKLVELGATEEMVNSLANLTGNVAGVLAEMPDNIRLSFVDDAKANEIGAYIVTAVVTDSDHYPSVDAGYLVVVPDVDMFELKWKFEDGNGIFTRDLLDQPGVDLLAKAYDAKSGAYNEDATGKISYMFVGIDSNGKFKHYTNPATLPNGAYIELAYIELDVEGKMVVSDMIARPIVVVASNCKVNVENVETVFNNTAHGVKIAVTDLEGREIDTDNGTLTVLYAGLQTNGKAYMDTKAPVHAGVYEALVTYTETVDGELRYYGANAGYVLIDLAESNIDVTGETVTYDGNGHTATVVATGSGVTEPDYTLISGGAYVSGDIDEIGVDAFHGNVNIDLPTWMDKALAGYEFVDGVNAAKVADYIEAYRDELIASIKLDKLVEWNVMTEEEAVATIAKLNAYIDELVAVLKKMPTDVALTFVDDITYTEPGAYFYYGIVTDSDHYPSTDTGLLVIEKMDMVYDLLDTDYAWDGTGKMVEIYNPNNADALTLIIDRVNNTANFLIDNDAQYLLNTVARILGVEFDGDVQMSTILEKYNGAEVADAIIKMITEAEKLDLPEENAKALAAVKKQLQDLPADGTIVINGELPSEIGTYDVYAVSYSQYYKTNASEAELLIVPAHFGEILVTDVTYNGTEQTGEVVVMTGDGQIVDPSEYTVTGNKGTDAGAYTVTVEGINHYEGTVTLTWNILPAPVTITADAKTKVYGEDDPELTCTVTGLVNGETEAVLNIALDREDGEKVGEYEITATASNGNYAITIVPNTFTITKKAITVTADDVTKVYGEEDPTFTATIDTLVDGDKLNVTFTRVDGENVGEYKITPAVDALVNTRVMGNYDITCEQGTLTITKKVASITANDKTMVAGNPVPALDATVEGVIGEDTLNYTLSTKDPVAIGEHGTYEIVVTLGENPNYEVNWTNGNLIVQKCALTVDGVAYTDWASAMADISDGVANIKLYADVRYANDENNEPTQTKFAPNNDLTIDLNGYDLSFYGTITVNPNTKVNVVNGGSFTMEVAGWPLVLSNNNTLKMDESVVFTGAIQMNNKAKSDYYIGDECVIGKNSDALFQTTGDSNLVNVKFADGFMDLALQFGHLTLTKDLTTLDGQSVVIKDIRAADPGHLTIAKDVTLTLDPGTEITIANNSIVDGEGTIAVASAEHLALALSTDVANVKLVGSDEDTNIAMVEDGTVTLDLNKQSMKVGSLTVTGNMVIKDTASGDATPEAGKLLGTITVADGASLTLYAGTYSQDVQNYVADGYYAHDNGDGTWTVLKQIKLQSATDNTLRYYIGEAQGPETADFRVVAENGDVLTADQFTVLAAQQTNAGTYTATILPTYRAYTGMVENVVWGILPAEVILTVKDNTALAGTTEIPAVEFEVTKGAVTKGAVTVDKLAPSATWNVETKNGNLVHGEYVNGEVTYTKSDNWKVVEIVNGELTVELGKYVCWNPAAGIYWKDLSDALMIVSGSETEEVEMLASVEEDMIIVFAGTTLDLNGYYVEAGNLLSFGVVMDGAKVTGGIVISNDTTKAFTQLQPVNGGYLPIYDVDNGCYRFFAYTMSSFAARDNAADASVPADGVKFRFRLSFANVDAYKLLIDSDNTGLEMVVKLSWTGLENPILYTMDKDTLKDYAADAYDQMQTSGKNTQVMYLIVRGLYNLESGDSMSATPVIQSITDAAGESVTIPYSVS